MRDSKMDNIRFGLIFLVVLGHFFETCSSVTLKYATEFIYSFHMPVFVFISGYFAKFNPQRIVRTYFGSYVIMQIAYILFYRLYSGIKVPFQVSMPHFSLWYLLTMSIYCLLIPIIQTDRVQKKIAVIAICIALSFIAGSDAEIGYPFALGRFFSFLPFFTLGIYFRADSIPEKIKNLKTSCKVIFGSLLALAVAATEWFILKSTAVSYVDMTHSYTFKEAPGGWKARAILLGLGVLWILFLLIATPNKKIPLISNIGANTLPVYLFHGFIIKVLLDKNLNSLDTKIYAPLAIGLTLAMVLLFGNKVASSIAKWGFTGHWLCLFDKKEKKLT